MRLNERKLGMYLGNEKMHAVLPSAVPLLVKADSGHWTWLSSPVGIHS